MEFYAATGAAKEGRTATLFVRSVIKAVDLFLSGRRTRVNSTQTGPVRAKKNPQAGQTFQRRSLESYSFDRPRRSCNWVERRWPPHTDAGFRQTQRIKERSNPLPGRLVSIYGPWSRRQTRR